MYYKLPVKERMELMSAYRKANKDMSYHDMVKDYNDSYEKFKDGGKVDMSKIKLNNPKSQIEAEDMIKKGLIDTRRRVDKNGDDQGENLFEVFDPTGISSWNDVYSEYKKTGLSYQTAIEAIGAIPLLGKVSKLVKPAIHLSKKTPKLIKLQKAIANNNLSNAIDYTGKFGRASDGYQYLSSEYK